MRYFIVVLTLLALACETPQPAPPGVTEKMIGGKIIIRNPGSQTQELYTFVATDETVCYVTATRYALQPVGYLYSCAWKKP